MFPKVVPVESGLYKQLPVI